MRLDGADGNPEIGCDLIRRLAVRDGTEDFLLALGKVDGGEFFAQKPPDFRCDGLAADGDRSDGLEKGD